MRLLDLNGCWQMRAVGDTQWTDAIVPGSVYADLLRGGAMPDPFYRENEQQVSRLSERDYEYRRVFSVPADVLLHAHLLLQCEGLDTLCEIFLNEIKVLDAANMHRTVWNLSRLSVNISRASCPNLASSPSPA